jgi:hypothetical protein
MHCNSWRPSASLLITSALRAAEVMRDAGLALNATFKAAPVAGWPEGAGTVNTSVGVPIVVDLPAGGGEPFDYVVTMEDLRYGQRIANYTVEYQAVGGTTWEVLVPPVIANHSHTAPSGHHQRQGQVRPGDRPDGHDPRDQYVGRKRIDFPIVNTSTAMSDGGPVVSVARVRFTCLRALEVRA